MKVSSKRVKKEQKPAFQEQIALLSPRFFQGSGRYLDKYRSGGNLIQMRIKRRWVIQDTRYWMLDANHTFPFVFNWKQV